MSRTRAVLTSVRLTPPSFQHNSVLSFFRSFLCVQRACAWQFMPRLFCTRPAQVLFRSVYFLPYAWKQTRARNESGGIAHMRESMCACAGYKRVYSCWHKVEENGAGGGGEGGGGCGAHARVQPYGTERTVRWKPYSINCAVERWVRSRVDESAML